MSFSFFFSLWCFLFIFNLFPLFFSFFSFRFIPPFNVRLISHTRFVFCSFLFFTSLKIKYFLFPSFELFLVSPILHGLLIFLAFCFPFLPPPLFHPSTTFMFLSLNPSPSMQQPPLPLQPPSLLRRRPAWALMGPWKTSRFLCAVPWVGEWVGKWLADFIVSLWFFPSLFSYLWWLFTSILPWIFLRIFWLSLWLIFS